jgi:integrase
MGKIEMNQAGYVFRKGNSWFVRYRESLVEGGEVVRKQCCKKLCGVASEHARLKNPPEEVLEQAEEFLAPMNSGKVPAGKNVLLGEFIEHVYFVNKASELRASTLHGYKQRWRSLLAPRCKMIRLREFDTPTAQRVLKVIAPGQAKSTMDHLKTLLSGAFRHAIQQGYHLGPNPIRETTVPRAREAEETYAYPLNDELAMIAVLPEPARTMVGLASFGGLRRAELAGTEWPNYTGKQIWVTQSVWEGIVDEPKTRRSKAPIPVIAPLQQMLDAHKTHCGNPTTGPMFATMDGKKAIRPSNVVNRQILPVLNACECGKTAEDHAEEDHEYKRNAALPQWRGWHPFRRGLATNLHDLGIDDITVQKILRHANVAVTQASYIKTLDSQQINAMRQLERLVEERLALPATA